MFSIIQQCDIIADSPKSNIEQQQEEEVKDTSDETWMKAIQSITSYLRNKSNLDLSTTIFPRSPTCLSFILGPP